MKLINCKMFGIAATSILVLLFLSVIPVSTQTGKIRLEINPNAKCGTDDICYKVLNLPKSGAAFAEIKSDFFFAVVLKTTEKCGTSERERLKIQALFPKNKVFTSTVDCDLAEDNAAYENLNENDYGFVAVYAGRTKAEAEKFLKVVKAANKFPGANIRKTRIVVSGT